MNPWRSPSTAAPRRFRRRSSSEVEIARSFLPVSFPSFFFYHHYFLLLPLPPPSSSPVFSLLRSLGDLHLFRFSVLQPFPLSALPSFHSSALPHSRTPALPLSHSPTLPLSHSSTLPLFHSPTLPLSHSPTLLLFCSFALQLFCSFALLLFCEGIHMCGGGLETRLKAISSALFPCKTFGKKRGNCHGARTPQQFPKVSQKSPRNKNRWGTFSLADRP